MKHRVSMVLVGLVVVLTGCSTTKYYWGSYETALYKHYKNPGDREYLGQQLAGVIERGERRDRVPPGIYAEYGYVLLVHGKAKEAIVYFEQEKRNWPESTHLMNIMIENARAEQEKKLPAETNDKK